MEEREEVQGWLKSEKKCGSFFGEDKISYTFFYYLFPSEDQKA